MVIGGTTGAGRRRGIEGDVRPGKWVGAGSSMPGTRRTRARERFAGVITACNSVIQGAVLRDWENLKKSSANKTKLSTYCLNNQEFLHCIFDKDDLAVTIANRADLTNCRAQVARLCNTGEAGQVMFGPQLAKFAATDFTTNIKTIVDSMVDVTDASIKAAKDIRV